MNRFRTVMMLLLAVSSLMVSSCQKESEGQDVEYLDVTAHNISGKWELIEWNGAELEEGTYMYLDIVRDKRTYTMYQNMDSFQNVPHVITGMYYIETDPEYGAVIRGSYDHDLGDWSHRYVVKYLTVSEMVWVAKDDESFIQKFSRIENIPLSNIQ